MYQLGWVTTYGKIVISKDEGIMLEGVYYGGSSNDKTGAEELARNCVNTIKGATIMPRIAEVTEPNQLIGLLLDCADWMEKTVQSMKEADAVISKASKKR
jgi:hypothetical protein